MPVLPFSRELKEVPDPFEIEELLEEQRLFLESAKHEGVRALYLRVRQGDRTAFQLLWHHAFLAQDPLHPVNAPLREEAVRAVALAVSMEALVKQ